MSAQEKPELRVWQFLDGLPGHEKQSDALVTALSSRAELDLLRINWPLEGSDFFKLNAKRKFTRSFDRRRTLDSRPFTASEMEIWRQGGIVDEADFANFSLRSCFGA